MTTYSGESARILALTIWTLGHPHDMRKVAADIFRRSREPRSNARPIADICRDMALIPVDDPDDQWWPEAQRLAEEVMAATIA
jgi:hypothetical protein